MTNELLRGTFTPYQYTLHVNAVIEQNLAQRHHGPVAREALLIIAKYCYPHFTGAVTLEETTSGHYMVYIDNHGNEYRRDVKMAGPFIRKVYL